jgi:lysozyme
MVMHISSNAVEVLHYFESCKLLAYPDPASPLFKACVRAKIDPYRLRQIPKGFEALSGAPWTIGWGDTGNAKVGMVISQQEADDRFERRMRNEFEPMVRKALLRGITQGEFDGYTSGVFNVGPGGRDRDGLIRLRSGEPSTVLRRLNAGDTLGAANALLAWNKAGGQVMLGLRRRRAAERALMLGSTGREAIAIGAAIT